MDQTRKWVLKTETLRLLVILRLQCAILGALLIFIVISRVHRFSQHSRL